MFYTFNCEIYDERSNLEFDLHLSLHSIIGMKPNVDACVMYDEDDDIPECHFCIEYDHADKTHYSHLYPVIQDAIRHEIEHLTQRGYNVKEGKQIRSNFKLRTSIQNNESIYYRYYLLKDELDANVHGLYARAKALREPYQNVVENYLDSLIKDGIIEETHKKRIYSKMRTRIKKIGGIPQLK